MSLMQLELRDASGKLLGRKWVTVKGREGWEEFSADEYKTGIRARELFRDAFPLRFWAAQNRRSAA